MKIYYYIILLLLLVVSGCKPKNENYLTKYGIKGKVSEIIYHYHDAELLFGEWVPTESIQRIHKFLNREGDIIREDSYFSGELSNRKIVEIKDVDMDLTAIYDYKGKLEKKLLILYEGNKELHFDLSPDNDTSFFAEVKKTKLGNQTEHHILFHDTTVIHSEVRYVYEFDERGRIISTNTLRGEEESTKYYQYSGKDEKGNWTKLTASNKPDFSEVTSYTIVDYKYY